MGFFLVWPFFFLFTFFQLVVFLVGFLVAFFVCVCGLFLVYVCLFVWCFAFFFLFLGLLFCILLVPGSSSQKWLKVCFFLAFVPMNLAFLPPLNLTLNCIFSLTVLHEGFAIVVTPFLNFSPSNFEICQTLSVFRCQPK